MAETISTIEATSIELAQPPRSLFREALRRLARHRGAMVGLAVLVLVILASIFATALAPYDPIKSSARESLEPPGAAHLFGTDFLGRDVCTRVLYGGRVS